jgi:hypothetical protein
MSEFEQFDTRNGLLRMAKNIATSALVSAGIAGGIEFK